MIVVDTNILAYLYLASENLDLVERALLKDPEWAAPILWRSEMRNVLAFQVRQKRIGSRDALRIMDEAEALMSGREFEVGSPSVLRLAEDSGCSAYDCEFVALAQELAVLLLTTDRQILNRFPESAIPLALFAAR